MFLFGLEMKSKTSCVLEKWSTIDSIPNPVCSFLNKLYVVFLTLISGELALQTSDDCKNLTLQLPCRFWEGCSSCEMSPVLPWGQGQACGLAHVVTGFLLTIPSLVWHTTSSLPEDMTFTASWHQYFTEFMVSECSLSGWTLCGWRP
jgi:hypothetical protein